MSKKIGTIFIMAITAYGSIYSGPLSLELGNTIEAPEFVEAPLTSVNSADMINSIEPVLKDRLVSLNYDRVFPMLEFINYFNKRKIDSPDLKPIDAFKTFRMEMVSPKNRGGPCVTLTLDLLESLPSEFNAYPCLAQLPGSIQQFGFPMYSHSAVLIKCDGQYEEREIAYLLLDPSFDIDKPIIIKSDGSSSYYDTQVNGVWSFRLHENKIICEFERKGALHQMIYLTDRVTNVVQSSAMPMLLGDRRLSLLSRGEDGLHIAHLNIELNKDRIVWAVNRERQTPISFAQFLEGKSLPDDFARALHMSPEDLSSRIDTIIKNRDILDSLHKSYIDLIKKTGDFSITGDIDL